MNLRNLIIIALIALNAYTAYQLYEARYCANAWSDMYWSAEMRAVKLEHELAGWKSISE